MLSRDQVKAVYDQGFEATYALIQALEGRLLRLEEHLGLSSRNSSKPPSSDVTRPGPKSLRTPSGKKPGGQKGHPGNTLQLVEVPDQVVTHKVERCAGCGASLRDLATMAYEPRQVFELPPLSLYVTEHRAETKQCPCCAMTTKASFPAAVRARVQYGARYRAFLVYLNTYQLMPYDRLCQMMGDLFGSAPSAGTAANMVSACSEALGGFEEALTEELVTSAVLHADETGCYLSGHRHWLHVHATGQATLYRWHRKRGREAMDAIGVLPRFRGTVVHDGWSSYRHYEHARHGLCNAHHLRELVAQSDRGFAWADQMKDLLLEIKSSVDRQKAAGAAAMPAHEQRSYLIRYERILKRGMQEMPPPKPRLQVVRQKHGVIDLRYRKGKRDKAFCLLDRLRDRASQVLRRSSIARFMRDFSVPFDNNLAERDIRMMKVKQKVSGCFRSEEGASSFCRIRSYVSTMRKQGRDVFDALEAALTGQPFAVLPS